MTINEITIKDSNCFFQLLQTLGILVVITGVHVFYLQDQTNFPFICGMVKIPLSFIRVIK